MILIFSAKDLARFYLNSVPKAYENDIERSSIASQLSIVELVQF